MMKRKLIVVFCLSLFLSAGPTMADMVGLYVWQTEMTVDVTGSDGQVATATVGPSGVSGMNIAIKRDITSPAYQALTSEAADVVAVLNFVGSGNDYDVSGSLEVRDGTGDIKIAADFDAHEVLWTSTYGGGNLSVRSYLRPQAGNSSILLGSPWEYEGITSGNVISLDDNAVSYDVGDIWVMEYNVPDSSLQNFLRTLTSDDSTNVAWGHLDATVVPVPGAVLLGMLGLGAVGIKLRKFA